MRKVSIKIKITLWFTAIMLLIVGVALSTILIASSTTIEKNYKRQLQDTVEENIGEIEYEDGILEIDDDFVAYQHGVFVFLYDKNGDMILGEDHGIPHIDTPLQDKGVYEVTSGNQSYLVYDVPVYLKEYGEVWLRGLAGVEGSTQVSSINTVINISFFTLPILTLLAAVAGYILTKHSFKPIEDIIDSVERITEGKDLSKRIGLEKGNDEVYRLAQSFDNMFERLERSFEAEKKFTSDASHELRTPTSVILAQCEYALDGEKSIEEYQEALEVIERQGYKMSRLISQLLAFTRLEQQTGAIKKESIHLSELVSTICEEQAYLKIKEITIQCHIEPHIYACVDQTLISRLLINLISNAYQYGKEEGHIVVTLRNVSDKIYLSVLDDGIGIKEEDLSKIWGRFYRVDESRSNTTHHSMGLGLAMVKQIAQIHEGEVKVNSKLGEGSEFTLILPKNSL